MDRFPERRIHDPVCRQIPVIHAIVRGLRHKRPPIEGRLELCGALRNAGFELVVYCEQGLFDLLALLDFLVKIRFCTLQLDGTLSEELPAPQRRPESEKADDPVHCRPGVRNSRR